MSDHPHPTKAAIWYHASLALIAMTLLLTIGSAFDPRPGQLGFLCFIGFFAMYASSGSFDRDEGRRKLPRPWRVMDWLLLTLRTLGFPFALIVFAFGASGPEIVDGQFCLTSHGEITSYISQESYHFRSLCEQMMGIALCLPFAADAAIQCRARHLQSEPSSGDQPFRRLPPSDSHSEVHHANH